MNSIHYFKGFKKSITQNKTIPSPVKLKKCLDCPAMIKLGRSLHCIPCSEIRAEDIKRKAQREKYHRRKAEHLLHNIPIKKLSSPGDNPRTDGVTTTEDIPSVTRTAGRKTVKILKPVEDPLTLY